jgi:hypothetical protein
MQKQLLGCVALLLSSSATLAAPTVTGNTISWPDDGWYQVQVVNNYGIVEVCQGGRSCEVSEGNYIVINHTTGERFKNIRVSAGVTGSHSAVGLHGISGAQGEAGADGSQENCG